jgi:hypothetical protein
MIEMTLGAKIVINIVLFTNAVIKLGIPEIIETSKGIP